MSPILDLAELTGQAHPRSTLPLTAPSVPPTVVHALERIESEVWKDLCPATSDTIRAASGADLEPIGPRALPPV